MYWFKWLEIFNIEKDTIKSKNLMVQSHTSHTDTKLRTLGIGEQFIYSYAKHLIFSNHMPYNGIKKQL
jgi:hypothetical protein